MISAANIEHGLAVFRRLEAAAPILSEKRLGMLLDTGIPTLDGVPRTKALGLALDGDRAHLTGIDPSVVQRHASKAVKALERAQARLIGEEPVQAARAGVSEPRVAPPRAAPRAEAPPRPATPPGASTTTGPEQRLAAFEAAMKGVDLQGRKAFFDLFVSRGVPIDVGARQVNELRSVFRSPKDPELFHQWIRFADRGVDPSVAAEQVRDIARTTAPRLTGRGTNNALMAEWNRRYGT